MSDLPESPSATPTPCKPEDVFDFAVGLRATHAHVKNALGPRRFRAMMKALRPAIAEQADGMKVPLSVAAFQLASQPDIPQEQKAAYIAAAVELKLTVEGGGN